MNKTPTLSKRAKDLAERTSDAYSFDRFRSWPACAAVLLRRGFSEREAEAILRSKHMRWAGDSSNADYGRIPAAALACYLDKCRLLPGSREVRDLVAGTF